MSYVTVAQSVSVETVVKRSRFIGYVMPISDEETAQRLLAEIRKENSFATHLCYAYITDTSGFAARYSDDGEPKGTAGRPILEVLKKRGIVRCAIAVVRYFGGIKLGTGGLLRAYSDSAAAALDAATLVRYETKRCFELQLDYETASLIRTDEEYDRTYDQKVTIRFSTTDENALRNMLAEKLGYDPNLIDLGERELPVHLQR